MKKALGVSQEADFDTTSKPTVEKASPSLFAQSEFVGTQAGDVFWPGTLLPSVVPDARIYTWGYDANVDSF
jgi:hypothetical protein